MKPLLVLSLIIISCHSNEGKKTGADENAVKEALIKLEKESWEAWKNHDSKFFEKFLSDDHVEIGFGGPTDKAAVVASVGSSSCTVKTYSVDRFELTILEANVAVLTYHASQETLCNGMPVPSPVWVSSVYLKREGRWLNVIYQQTQTNR